MAETSLTEMIKVLKTYGQEVVLEMQKILVDTVNLKKSLKVIIEEKENELILGIKMPEYGLYVDRGRKPGSKPPPISVIKDWVKTKGIGQFRDDKGRFITNNSQAFLIARKIGRDGIKARPFFHVLLNDKSKVNIILTKALAKDLKNNLVIILEQTGIDVEG